MNDHDLFPPDDSDANHLEDTSPFRLWIKENPTLARFLTAWLLFILEMIIAKLVGDFNNIFLLEFPRKQTYYTILNTVCLALLSIVNIYGVPAFTKWFQSNDRAPATRLILFGGIFLSFFCAPIAGAGVSLSFALFLTLTVVHSFGRLLKHVEGDNS